MMVYLFYVNFTSIKLILKEKWNKFVGTNEYVVKVMLQYKMVGNTPKRMRL